MNVRLCVRTWSWQSECGRGVNVGVSVGSNVGVMVVSGVGVRFSCVYPLLLNTGKMLWPLTETATPSSAGIPMSRPSVEMSHVSSAHAPILFVQSSVGRIVALSG